MKKLILFFFVIFSLTVSAQYREVDWKCVVDSVVTVTDSTYKFRAVPFDYNDVGAANRIIGNYFVDFVGNRYQIIDSTSTTITVYDEFRTGSAPQTEQVGHVYRSVGGGSAPYIGGLLLTYLDESAQSKIVAADNELLWREFRNIPQAEQEIGITQTAHGLSQLNAIYKDGSLYKKAIADTTKEADVIGIVTEIVSVDSFKYQSSGVIDGSFTDGANYFLSPSTAGLLTTTPNYAIGDVYQFIGTGIGDGQLLLEIDVGIIVDEGGSSGEVVATTGDTISSMYYSNDTLFITESGNLWKAEIVGGSGSGSATLYEKTLADAETVVNTGILLDANVIVWLNGEIVPTANWSGEGTMNVTLAFPILQYDQLIVYKSSIPIAEIFEVELANNQTTIDIGFTPNATTIVFFNGQALTSDLWTDSGTEITLLFPVLASDKLIAKN